MKNNNIELYGLKISSKSNKIRKAQQNKRVVTNTIKTVKKSLILPLKWAYYGLYSIVKYIDGIVFASNFKKQKAIYNFLYIPSNCFKTKKQNNSKYLTISNKNKVVRL